MNSKSINKIRKIYKISKMQPQTYQQFAKLSKDQQYEMVINKKQAAPSAFHEPTKFPEMNFIALNTTQEKKPIKLATYRYPAQKTKGVVILFHTMGYHMGIYSNTAKIFANNGFTVVGYDQRGHGKSQGERGYLDDFELMMKDGKTFIDTIFKTYPNVPIFIMGHGAGSLIAFVFSQQFKEYKFAGIILTSTALKKPAHSKVLSALSDVAFKLMPNKTGLFEPQFENISSNPKVCEYLRNDPDMFKGKVFVGTLMQMMNFMEKNDEKNWKKLQTPPIVLVQGQYDKVADPINSINFYESIKTKDKQLWWYPNMWNNWFFEPEADEINARLVKWLNSKV